MVDDIVNEVDDMEFVTEPHARGIQTPTSKKRSNFHMKPLEFLTFA